MFFPVPVIAVNPHSPGQANTEIESVSVVQEIFLFAKFSGLDPHVGEHSHLYPRNENQESPV
jgi:hypothetical protein